MARKLASISTSQGVLNLQGVNKPMGASLKFKNTKDKRAHELRVNENPQEWIYLDLPNRRDWYRKDKIKPLVEAAKTYGLDPHDFVSLIIEESGLGNNPKNPSGNYTNVLYEKLTPEEEAKFQAEVAQEMAVPYPDLKSKREGLDRIINKYNVLRSAKHLQRMQKNWPDRIQGLQAYKGEFQADLLHPVKGRIIAGNADLLRQDQEFNDFISYGDPAQEDPIFQHARITALDRLGEENGKAYP